jgi:hypothetical protein
MIQRVEWGVVIASTVILIGLHLTFFFSAGSLWRDEVNCLNVADLSLTSRCSRQSTATRICWCI